MPLMLLRYFAALILAFPLVVAFTMQPHVGAIKPVEEISHSKEADETKEKIEG